MAAGYGYKVWVDVGRWTKLDNRPTEFPRAKAYLAGLRSLSTPTGTRDGLLLDALIAGSHEGCAPYSTSNTSNLLIFPAIVPSRSSPASAPRRICAIGAEYEIVPGGAGAKFS